MKEKQAEKYTSLQILKESKSSIRMLFCLRGKKKKTQKKLQKSYKNLPEVFSHVCIDLKIISIWRQNILKL